MKKAATASSKHACIYGPMALLLYFTRSKQQCMHAYAFRGERTNKLSLLFLPVVPAPCMVVDNATRAPVLQASRSACSFTVRHRWHTAIYMYFLLQRRSSVFGVRGETNVGGPLQKEHQVYFIKVGDIVYLCYVYNYIQYHTYCYI